MKYGAVIESCDLAEHAIGVYAKFTHTPIDTRLMENEEGFGDYTRIAVTCMKLKHMSVFEFAHLTYVVTCPIYVARQLMRHRNGVFLEKSLRFLTPESNVDDIGEDDVYKQSYAEAVELYKKLRESGERKEKARSVLTLGTPTQFIWQLSLRSLLNVFEQRITREAQKETRAIAIDMYNEAHRFYPLILDEWLKGAVKCSEFIGKEKE